MNGTSTHALDLAAAGEETRDDRTHVAGAREISRTTLYLGTWGVLFLLTAIEVAIAMAGVSREVLASVLITLAFVKVALIAAVFMHLWWERRWLGLIALTPLPFLVIFAITLLLENAH